jgi:hypothetical protein
MPSLVAREQVRPPLAFYVADDLLPRVSHDECALDEFRWGIRIHYSRAWPGKRTNPKSLAPIEELVHVLDTRVEQRRAQRVTD